MENMLYPITAWALPYTVILILLNIVTIVLFEYGFLKTWKEQLFKYMNLFKYLKYQEKLEISSYLSFVRGWDCK